MFVTEFAELLESVVMTAKSLVLAGDFNIHVNIIIMTDNDAAQFFFVGSSFPIHSLEALLLTAQQFWSF